MRIPNASYVSYVATFYVSYVMKHYGSAIVVFDGYKSGPSTKDITHLRRSKGCIGISIQFEESMIPPIKKTHFLTNSENKQRFIILLGSKLEENGCSVHHAIGC